MNIVYKKDDRLVKRSKKVVPQIVTQCKKCKATPPTDEYRTTESWLVYDTSKPCKCGGGWETILK